MRISSQPPTTCLSGFEGPEKKLEVHFKFNPKNKNGLRAVSKETWQTVLDYAKCTIISTTSNDYFDSYVLSESSLFVYPYKVMLKTCGTTSLLHCLTKIVELADEIDSHVDQVVFSRKNFSFPAKQPFPHCNFDDEVNYLNKLLKGEGYVLGPLNKDHWHFYVADYRKNKAVPRTGQTFEIMMHDLDPAVMEVFYEREGVSARDVTEMSGIVNLLPGSVIDEYQFSPCGYSMNGLLKEWYWTIHITPESHCSYVSFETNAPLKSYTRILQQVVSLFRPGRFTVALLADDGAPCGDPATAFDMSVPDFGVTSQTLQAFPGDYSVVMCNFALDSLLDTVDQPIH